MDELAWPFKGSEVLAARAIPERAMRKWYVPVYPDVYAPRGAELTAEQRARAAWMWSGRRGVVAGQSAAALLGATGAKLFATMLNELERTGGRYGLQTMCEGGGTANVTIVERL